MATKTFTIDTGEWIYIDKNGSPHTVTNAQTFTTTMTDGSATKVDYYVDAANSMTTTDGYTLYFRPEVDGGMGARKIEIFADTEDATGVHNKAGELCIECPVTGIVQRWRVAQITIDDVDTPTAVSGLKLEDQFGNVMDLPSTGSGITVA